MTAKIYQPRDVTDLIRSLCAGIICAVPNSWSQEVAYAIRDNFEHCDLRMHVHAETADIYPAGIVLTDKGRALIEQTKATPPP